MERPKHILVIKPSSLGDVVTTLPMVCDLRRAFPEARIDWLIYPAFAGLVEGHDAVKGSGGEVIGFDRKKLGAWWYRPTAFRAFRELVRRLRGNRYDLVIDAQGLLRSGFLGWATGAKRRIGFANAREGAAWSYTDRVRLPERGRRMLAVDRMRALLGPLGVAGAGPAEFRVPVSAAASVQAEGLLARAGIGGDRVVVAVIPGARWATKRWDVGRYSRVVGRLVDEGECVVLLGSADEAGLCDEVSRAAEGGGGREDAAGMVVNLAGRTSLAEMVAILARAELVIANDSGPLHVAAALGRRTVGIYGPTSEAFVGPYGQMENVVRHEVWCHPCRRRTCEHHSCMKGVGVELVWEKTRGLLEMVEKVGGR